MSIRLTIARRKTARMQASVQAKLDELGQHSRDLKEFMRLNEEFKAARGAEPVVRCVNPIGGWPCGAEMRQGDYRCPCCGAPNPDRVDRGLEPPKFPRLS